jgi:hypothetical protein
LETALGLLGMVVFIAATIGLAASITYAIVKVSPSGRRAKDQSSTPS